mmetsp:Transcript_64460/g.78822  ORF Transcript_64460/g.78822 Transcript_64460/m.78822 type:complete len:457 (-) Transcript_64460:63-1433(-)
MKVAFVLITLVYLVISGPTDLTGLYGIVVFNRNTLTPSLNPTGHRIDLIELSTGNVIRTREVDSYQGLTIDRSTNIIYSVDFVNGEVVKWDICLETETICGDTNLCPAGLDFVPGSSNVGGTLILSEKGTQDIYSFNLTSGTRQLIGKHAGNTIIDLIITKDSNGILTSRSNPSQLNGNILPPTIGTTTFETLPSGSIGHSSGPNAIDWLFPSNPSEEKIFACWSRTGEVKDCYIFDRSSQSFEGPILTFDDQSDAKGVVIVDNIGSCPNDPPPPPNDDPRECLCNFDILNPDLQYCRSECCGVGMIAQTSIGNDFFEYGVDLDNLQCYIKQNGVITLSESLTKEQFYECEKDLAFVTQSSNCTISESKDYFTIYYALKSFVNSILTDNNISIFLVVCYGLFVFMSLATVIFFMIKFIKIISRLFKSNNKNDGYSALIIDNNTDAGNNTATTVNDI